MDEGLVEGTPEELKTDQVELLGEDVVRHRISDLVRYASDASPYRFIPKVIVQPKNIDDVAGIFRYCIRMGRRAGMFFIRAYSNNPLQDRLAAAQLARSL